MGAVKGAILSNLPDISVVDISHAISPFNIQECAYILRNAYRSFPKGTVHMVGVDSEISPENEHIVVQVDGHYFVSANSGVISLITSEVQPEKVVEINLPNAEASAFPVLNIFVQVACHIARGGKLEVIGRPLQSLKELRDFEPRITNEGKTITGNVIYIDNYGNVVSNVTKKRFNEIGKGRKFVISARNIQINKVYESYSDAINFKLPKEKREEEGKKLALFNTSEYLELAVYKSNPHTVGSAASLFGLKLSDTVSINFENENNYVG